MLGLSATTDGAQTLLTKAESLLPALLRVGCTNAGAAAGAPAAAAAAATDSALGALVNLAQDPAAADALRGPLRAIPRCMDALRDDDDGGGGGGGGDDATGAPPACSLRAERRLGLLANLTAQPAGAAALLAPGGSASGGAANLARLLGAFLGGEAATDAVAPLLTNVTGTAAGRALLLVVGAPASGDGRPGLAGGLAAAAAQILAPGASSMRRAGCAAALRNCCLAAAQAQADAEDEAGEAGGDGEAAMGAVLSADVLRPALVALCGDVPALRPDGGGQEGGGASGGDGAPARGPDPEEGVREALAEAVLSLAGTAPGRAALWRAGAPDALRLAYADEEGPGVCEAMEKTARLFLDNAGGVEEVEEEDGEGGGGGGGGVRRSEGAAARETRAL